MEIELRNGDCGIDPWTEEELTAKGRSMPHLNSVHFYAKIDGVIYKVGRERGLFRMKEFINAFEGEPDFMECFIDEFRLEKDTSRERYFGEESEDGGK